MSYAAEEFYSYLDRLNEHRYNFSLTRINRAVKALGNPQNDFSVIHLAGSNGKGSTAAYLDSVLRAHKIKTGVYTSPHIFGVRERFAVNGKTVPEKLFVKTGIKTRELLADKNIKLTYFEFLTALAMVIFREAKVKTAVIEAGLGGRYDATNLKYEDKKLSVITSVCPEHVNYLGKTPSAILKEKSRIIKKGRAVCNIKEPALKKTLKREFKKRVFFPADLFSFVSLAHFRGRLIVNLKRKDTGDRLRVISAMPEFFQADNIITALMCVKVLSGELGLNMKKSVKAISETCLPGRLSRHEGYYLSAAHNAEAIAGMLATLRSMYPRAGIKFVFSALADKDLGAIFSVFKDYLPLEIILTSIDNKRAISIDKMARFSVKYGIKFRVEPDNKKALNRAVKEAKKGGVAVAGGSFYLVSSYIKENKPGLKPQKPAAG